MTEPERIARIEGRVDRLDGEMEVVQGQLAAHGSAIDTLKESQHKTEMSLLAISKDVESTKEGVDRVEETVKTTAKSLDDLKQQKINDHYKEPLANYRKIKWAIILGLVTFLLGFVLSGLFPGK